VLPIFFSPKGWTREGWRPMPEPDFSIYVQTEKARALNLAIFI